MTTTEKRGIRWNTPLGRILLIGLLVLLLQIPVLKISGVVYERSQSRDAAVEDISSKWGRRQSLSGPYLVVPYIKRWTETDALGRKTARQSTEEAQFLPDALSIDGSTQSETRQRGIFAVPLYSASLRLAGRFSKPSFEQWDIRAKDILWKQARMVIRISDPRAIADSPALTWGEETLTLKPGAGGTDTGSGVHALMDKRLDKKEIDFDLTLRLNGSESLGFMPFAESTTVQLRSDWPHPRFSGNWLPREHTVDDAGFNAQWAVSHLGRNYPQRMLGMAAHEPQIRTSEFGVDFISPVDTYRVSERLVKYALLFLGLTFITLWLFELLARLRVHPVQYLMVGAAMCLFYLLQLSLAEHLGLLRAYLIASGAIASLVTAYCLSVLRSPLRAATVGGILAALYGYFYVLLQLEDYALLIGSIGLVVALSIVMYLTRRIDWYGENVEPPAV